METNRKASVLIVDDSDISRILLREMLTDRFEITEASSGYDALELLRTMDEKPELLLLDIMMPHMDGYAVMAELRKDPLLMHIPVICITASDEEFKGLNAGAVDYVFKPFDPEAVKLRVSNQIELTRYRHQLERMVDEKAQELVSTKETMLETLADMIEYRSLESGMHIKRTQKLTEILVKHLLTSRIYGPLLANCNIKAMIKASALHDIGKIGIPDNILLKPGKLTPEEFDIIKTHTVIGSDIFNSLLQQQEDEYYRFCYEISRSHHERWDGSGYPDHLSKEDIPLSARILALVDVYDALVSTRCYKEAIPHDEAIHIIEQGSGSHFDPSIVDALLEVRELIGRAMLQLQ